MVVVDRPAQRRVMAVMSTHLPSGCLANRSSTPAAFDFTYVSARRAAILRGFQPISAARSARLHARSASCAIFQSGFCGIKRHGSPLKYESSWNVRSAPKPGSRRETRGARHEQARSSARARCSAAAAAATRKDRNWAACPDAAGQTPAQILQPMQRAGSEILKLPPQRICGQWPFRQD